MKRVVLSFSGIVGLLMVLFAILILAYFILHWIDINNARSIGKIYLDAVVKNDIQKALDLAHNNESCVKEIKTSFENESHQFKGADLKNIKIVTHGEYFNGGGLGPMGVWIRFQYKKDSMEWKSKIIYVGTDDIDVRGRRDACGSIDDSNKFPYAPPFLE